MNGRIKTVRESLKLTQEEFGKKIGSARNTIANYENGNRKPSNSVILSICREFNVSEDWLRHGTGEMFLEIPEEDEYFKAATMISKENDTDAMNAIIKYWKMDPASKKAFWNFLHNLIEK